jgi:hypothetical protein
LPSASSLVIIIGYSGGEKTLGRKNYAYGAEKRRKEVERQKKQEEKRARRRNKAKAQEDQENSAEGEK